MKNNKLNQNTKTKRQFTGLYDMHGKRIFVGDILSPPANYNIWNHFVVGIGLRAIYVENENHWIEHAKLDYGVFLDIPFAGKNLDGDYIVTSVKVAYPHGKSLRVIGDIYNNPELLPKGYINSNTCIEMPEEEKYEVCDDAVESLKRRFSELKKTIEQMKPLEIGETVYYKDKAGNIAEAKIAFIRDQYIELDNDILMLGKSLHRNREDLLLNEEQTK